MTERAQRRGRAIAMTAAEVDEFLGCRTDLPGGDRRPGRPAARGAAVVRLGRRRRCG